MINKDKIIKIIDFCFLLYVFIMSLTELYKSIKVGDITYVELESVQLQSKDILWILTIIVTIVIFSIVKCLLNNFQLTVLYFGIRIALKVYYKDKLDKEDLKKNKEYYMNLIQKYSPGVLKYIDDYKIDESTIISTLMSLELKKIISFKDKIEILTNEVDSLDNNEKYIFQQIKNGNIQKGNIKKIIISEYEDNIIKDCKEYKLLDEKNDIKKKIVSKVISCILIYTFVIGMIIFLPLIISYILSNANAYYEIFILLVFIMYVVLLVLAIIYPIISIVYIATYFSMNKVNPYIRNNNGKDINRKLEGLKNYIKDMSLLEDKSKDHMILWEDYLIYSVVFGINKKIIDEYK